MKREEEEKEKESGVCEEKAIRETFSGGGGAEFAHAPSAGGVI
jgi:hypothetical protein